MRILVAAVAALSLLAPSAHAQMGKRPHGEAAKSEPKKPQIDEKAYKAALEHIPEPKEKYDPWGVARPTQPAKKPK